MVVLPFVPVTAMTSSSREGSPKNRAAAGPIAARTLGTTHLGRVDVERPLDDERGRARRDGGRGQVVPIDGSRP